VGVDLSGLIFVVLAVGWAGYLIPKALRHHEEIAASRPVDSFSETMRVLERTPATMRALLTTPAPVGTAPVTSGRRGRRPSTPARRRRRVLGLLLLVTVATAVAAGLGQLPVWSPALAGALVVGWLVLCRLMVRKASQPRRVGRPPLAEASPTAGEGAPVGPLETPSPEVAPLALGVEDDGSLWDPLPLTLPTYVSKPAARRTVRTIDLTQTGVTSSGHKAADTELARQAEAAAAARPDSDAQRKAAGA
jgi:hypothetical protein